MSCSILQASASAVSGSTPRWIRNCVRVLCRSSMLDRHKTLTQFLIHLGVDPETAEADACKMEHDISQQTFEAICRHAGRAE